jgi:hypothetical protein
VTLANNSKEAQERAEASFKKKELQAREGAKAMAEYEAESIAVRKKTERLKALRLAKEESERAAEREKAPVTRTIKPRSPVRD